MDAESFRHSQSSKRKGHVFRCWSKRRTLSVDCPSNRQRRTRDREPYLLSSEPGALLAGTYSPGVERHAAVTRNDYRSRDDVISSAIQRRYRSDGAE